jgi:peptidoglycan/xylan/chitin deacetylase (PgdA/CDA1 family)
MKLVSPLLKRVVYPCLSSARVLQRHAKDRELSVVTYHGVLPDGYQSLDAEMDGSLVSASSFRRQLRFFKSNYNVIHPIQFHDSLNSDATLPKNALLITCDDGLLNNLTDMLPVLLEESVACLFFVTAESLRPERRMLWYEQLYLMIRLSSDPTDVARLYSFLGETAHDTVSPRALWWQLVKLWSSHPADKRVALLEDVRGRLRLDQDWMSRLIASPPAQRRFTLLTLSELLTLAAAGMEIGSHTLSHPMLSRASQQTAFEEISESRCLLEEVIQKPVWAFAYPFGDPDSVTAREIDMAQSAGYRCAVLNCETSSASRFAMSRLHMTADMSVPEIQAHLCGFHATLHRFARVEPTPVGKGA